MTIFTQWEKLVTIFRGIADAAVKEKARPSTVRLDLSTGEATFVDGAVNLVTFTGGEVSLLVPESEPGKARRFTVRADMTAETLVTFAGALFEGSAASELAPPAVNEKVVFEFVETVPGTLCVSRRSVQGPF